MDKFDKNRCSKDEFDCRMVLLYPVYIYAKIFDLNI
jgi:hypothetical protein